MEKAIVIISAARALIPSCGRPCTEEQVEGCGMRACMPSCKSVRACVCPYMKEKAESWSKKREVKKRARTTEFHACIPSTASWREPTCLWERSGRIGMSTALARRDMG